MVRAFPNRHTVSVQNRDRILLCCDLDRTLLPNGPQPESPIARPLLRQLAARPEISLAYVSGRDKVLLEAAIAEYALPRPDYAVGDVGTTIYEVNATGWQLWEAWHEEIAPDWHGQTREQLAALFTDLAPLRLQEAEKQNRFKLSYYLPLDVPRAPLLATMEQRLEARGVQASLIWSVDEPENIGLLDLLPARATKRHAVEFLLAQHGFRPEQTVFAGDSGNDLPVLISGLPAVLVRNASDEVQAEALAGARRADHAETLYIAKGGLLGMNGNYSAGVLEGLVHYHPQTLAWLQA